MTQFAWGMITSKGAVSSSKHPGLTVISPRVLLTGLSGYMSGSATTTGASGTGTTATLTFAAVPTAPYVGSVVTVNGVTPAGYNGSYTVTASSTTSVSYANTTTGSQTVAGTAVFATSAETSAPNNGQSIIYAANCSQIKIDQIYEGGYSYGISQGINLYTFTAGSTAPGPVTWGNDNAFTYGTARFNPAGKNGNVTLIPGDKPLIRLNSAALSYTATNFTVVPFSTVVADTWGWYDNAVTGVLPTRAQTVRFKAQAYTASAPIGRYTLLLYKNGANIGTLFDSYVSTASQALSFGGEFWDIPNGMSDYYNVIIFSTASFTLATSSSQTFFYAELQGT